MVWTRRKVTAAVLAAAALLGGVAAVTGMSFDGPSHAQARPAAMLFDGHGG